MEYGIALATTVESWRSVVRAEELGLAAAWFYDTQLLNPDVFVGMALAADRTTRIRLGTGVLIPSNRLAPVAANGFATLNRMAPGRIDFGVGTGFTGRRTMGQGAIRLADLERYVEEVQGLLGGETVEALLEGERRPIRFLNPELGLINVEDPVPVHVSAMGPRSRRTAARLGAGWLNFSGSVSAASRDLEDMRRAWDEAGRAAEALRSTLFVLGCILADDEPADSPRALAQAGPYVMVTLHNLVEITRPGELDGHVAPALSEALARYRRIWEAYPDDQRHLYNHRGHLMFLRDEERHLVTSELIRALTFTGTRAELAERLRALRDAGYDQFVVQLMLGHEDALEEWATLFTEVGS